MSKRTTIKFEPTTTKCAAHKQRKIKQ